MKKIDWLDHEDPNAIEWARQSAGNRIEYGPSGAKLADDLRHRIRAEIVETMEKHRTVKQLAEVLERQFGFHHRQASHIALDEIKTAREQASFQGAIRVGMQYKRWLLSNDPGVCGACSANAAQGWIEIAQPFSSGAFAPPGCSLCRCAGAYSRKPGL